MMQTLRSYRLQAWVTLVLLLFTAIAIAQSAPAPRITSAIDDKILVPLKGNTPGFARPKNDLGLAADDLQLRHVQLLLKRSPAQESELLRLLKAQQQTGAPEFHRWLSPQDFGIRFGVADADLETITKWLNSHGLEIETVANSRTLITFSGTHAQLRSAFHTELHRYDVKGETHIANASDPQVPAALASVVAGITTLTNVGPRPMHSAPILAKKTKGGDWQLAAAGKASPNFFFNDNGQKLELVGPGDFNIIYNVSPLWNASIDGTGETIAVVAESDINPSDVDAFRSAFGLPEKKLNVIYVGDNPGQTGGGVEAEAALDVEWSGAIAKNATIDLIVGGSTDTGGGVLLAMWYAVDQNVAPILSVSWGACELVMGDTYNQYFNMLWEQAAAQGISVLVAAGDAGSAACDQNGAYATAGEQVNGFASPPHATAVGGTDFSANFKNESKWWNDTNDPKTLASAKGYIPESPWNDSCASPQVLAAAQSVGYPETTNEGLCNDPNYPFTYISGGGGGASNCTSSDHTNVSTCTGGYPAPYWQASVPGQSSKFRRLPDISFFSGAGLWGSALMFCLSDGTPDGTCNYANGDVAYLAAGGTSFATPAFAGVLALLNQKTNSRLGNINPILYQVGAAQYQGALTGVFHDVTDGNISQPCLVGTTAVPPSTLCPITDPNDTFGVLPDYSAAKGYDMATGLGSVDVSKFADAWSAAVANLSPTMINLTVSGSSTVPYGTEFSTKVSVTPSSGSSTVSGLVALLSDAGALGSGDLNSGSATLSGNGLDAGSHTLSAHYGGSGTFASSTSSAVPITITQAGTSLQVSPSRSSLSAGQSTTFSMTVQAASTANSPTGNIVVTNTTTGSTVLTVPVSSIVDAKSGQSWAAAFGNIPGSVLSDGSNNLSVAYAGDTNFTGSTATQTIHYTGPFSVTLSSGTLTITPGATSGNTVTLTITPNGTAKLDPTTISLQCPGNLPAGLTCSFSAPAKGASGTVTSTLTIFTSGPLAQSKPRSGTYVSLGGGLAGLFGLALLVSPNRRRHLRAMTFLSVLTVLLLAIACGGGTYHQTTISPATKVTLAASSSSPTLGTAVEFDATVTPISGTSSPSGTVTFQTGANVIGSAALAAGKATFTTSSLPIGTQSVTAVYGGDATYMPSTSSVVPVDVSFSTNIQINVSDSANNLAMQTLAVTVR